eukprot:870733-Prymnesium_polylepis.1
MCQHTLQPIRARRQIAGPRHSRPAAARREAWRAQYGAFDPPPTVGTQWAQSARPGRGWWQNEPRHAQTSQRSTSGTGLWAALGVDKTSVGEQAWRAPEHVAGGAVRHAVGGVLRKEEAKVGVARHRQLPARTSYIAGDPARAQPEVAAACDILCKREARAL